jgi:uncharacterized protein (TIGR02246 family)
MPVSRDEAAIRAVIAEWFEASIAGETARVLPLMAEDAVFYRAGHEPMRGRAAFAAEGGVRAPAQMEAGHEIEEIEIRDGFAWVVNRLDIRAGGRHLKGRSMAIFRKETNGAWVLLRDANMLAPAG